MPIDWSDVEDALHTWLESAMATLGVDADRILWSDQEAPRGDGAYLTVRRGELVPIGPPAIELWDRTLDEAPEDITAGEEIERRIQQTFSLSVSLQAFDPQTVGDQTGAALLSEALMALSSWTAQDALHGAGLFVYDRGSVRNVTALAGADFESRAAVDVRFYLNDSRTERTGYIAAVEFTPTVDEEVLPSITLVIPEE